MLSQASMAALAIGLAASLLSGAGFAQSIFTCVDGKGRRLTSDRPIYECADRTQQEMTPTGTVKRIIGPTLTASERAIQEAKDRQIAEIRAREAEEKRRDRALLLRYPNKSMHDKERLVALAQIDEVIKAAAKRTTELVEQRKAINLDLEFYAKDPSKAPGPLKRRIEENDSSIALQKKFIADQDVEKQRVNQRFDEELVKLRQLWAMTALPGADSVMASPPGRQR